MKRIIPFTVVFNFLLRPLQAQSSCIFYQQDGTEIDVGEGFFKNPDFCNKECECVRSFPDFESGIPLDTTICGCSIDDKTTSELYCLVIGEKGLIPELGVCECSMEELPTLSCEPFKPTSPPAASPSNPSSSITPAPAGKGTESSKVPVSAGGEVSEPSISPASAVGEVPGVSPDIPVGGPSDTSGALNRSKGWELPVSIFVLCLVVFV